MKRRTFLKLSDTTARSVSALAGMPAEVLASEGGRPEYSTFGELPQPRNFGRRVAIFGGGVSGLTAAHELLDQGFEVSLYEANDRLGGKVRSMPVPGTDRNGSEPLPGEHGYRIFGTFYKHTQDIMRRIPYPGNLDGVIDNLVPLQNSYYMRTDAPDLGAFKLPEDFDDWKEMIRAFFGEEPDIPAREVVDYLRRILRVLKSSDIRRYEQLEEVSIWDYLESDSKSKNFQDLFGNGMSSLIQAVRGRDASARTFTLSIYAFFSEMLTGNRSTTDILKGPTSELWVSPWVDFLESRGLRIHYSHRLQSFETGDGNIRGAIVAGSRKPGACGSE